MLDVPEFHTTIEDPPPTPTGGAFAKFALVLVLAAAAVFGVRHYLGRPAALAAADRAAGIKPRLLMFTADWCGPCQNFKGTVLTNDRVINTVVDACKFEMVDLTKWEGSPAEVATRYGVKSIPTLILVNSKDEEFARYKGPHAPADFAYWVDTSTK